MWPSKFIDSSGGSMVNDDENDEVYILKSGIIFIGLPISIT